jgi:uncharacterized surface protein with fasciclin (FAS1) repeats
MRRITTMSIAALLAMALAVPAFAAKPSYAEAAKPGDASIVDIVLADDGEFDVLQAAVVEAGLVGLLDGKRQLTVFAPTDAAFISTFEGILGGPLTESDVIEFVSAGGVDAAFGDGALADILAYHVIPGRRTSKSVLSASSYDTLEGSTLSKGELVAGGVVPADISASNGVVHILTAAVLLP